MDHVKEVLGSLLRDIEEVEPENRTQFEQHCANEFRMLLDKEPETLTDEQRLAQRRNSDKIGEDA